MRYSYIAAPLALAAGANAWGNGTVVYTTEVVTAFTTYCPYATSFTHGTSTYVVTEATTLTITNCPCTVTKPVSTAPVVAATSSKAAPAASASATKAAGSSSSAGGAPAKTSPAKAPTSTLAKAPTSTPAKSSPIFSNSTISAGSPAKSATSAARGTAAPSGTSAPAASVSAFKGAASRMTMSGAGLAAVLGLAAYLL